MQPFPLSSSVEDEEEWKDEDDGFDCDNWLMDELLMEDFVLTSPKTSGAMAGGVEDGRLDMRSVADIALGYAFCMLGTHHFCTDAAEFLLNQGEAFLQLREFEEALIAVCCADWLGRCGRCREALLGKTESEKTEWKEEKDTIVSWQEDGPKMETTREVKEKKLKKKKKKETNQPTDTNARNSSGLFFSLTPSRNSFLPVLSGKFVPVVDPWNHYSPSSSWGCVDSDSLSTPSTTSLPHQSSPSNQCRYGYYPTFGCERRSVRCLRSFSVKLVSFYQLGDKATAELLKKHIKFSPLFNELPSKLRETVEGTCEVLEVVPQLLAMLEGRREEEEKERRSGTRTGRERGERKAKTLVSDAFYTNGRQIQDKKRDLDITRDRRFVPCRRSGGSPRTTSWRKEGN